MCVRVFLAFAREQGYDSLESIPPNILVRWTARMVDDDYSARTVRLYMAGARRYLKWLRDNGVAAPVEIFPEMPRVYNRVRGILPPEFLGRYMTLCDEMLHEPYRTAAQLFPCTGLRGGELAKLKLEAISKSKVQLRGGEQRELFVLRLIGKGGDERIVPVLEEGAAVLTEYLQGWRKHKRGPWLFPRVPTCKRAVSDRTIRLCIERIAQPLGIPLSPHTLRRTYLVRLWRRGVDATVIAKIAGHKNLNTTYRSYLNLDEQDILLGVFGENRGS